MGRAGRVVVLAEGDRQETPREKEMKAEYEEAKQQFTKRMQQHAKLRQLRLIEGKEEEWQAAKEAMDNSWIKTSRVPAGETERVARMLNERVEGMEVEKLEYVR